MDVLNDVLLPAMKDVGDRFGAGELILPFVLQSAEVMKKAVGYLEKFLDRVEGSTKGTVVLATVYGDVHDIGKNLVKTILSNNGFTVHDLGKQVPVATIIEKAVEVGADAIGLSALLVSTSKQMPYCVEELRPPQPLLPGAHRRRRHQPPLRPTRRHFVPGRHALRRRRLLRQGRLRGARAGRRQLVDPARREALRRKPVLEKALARPATPRRAEAAPAAARPRRSERPPGREAPGAALLGRAGGALRRRSRSPTSGRTSTSPSSTSCSGACAPRGRSTSG